MKFECDGCGQILSAGSGMGGQTVPCPTCDRPVTVPGKASGGFIAGIFHNNYFARHWRGELELPVSFWVNGTLGTAVVTYAMKRIVAKEEGLSMQASALCDLGLLLGTIAISTWQYVGIWRSASDRGASMWGMLTKCALVLGMLRLILLINLSIIPQAGNLLDILQGDLGLPAYTIQALPGGSEVVFRGGIRAGCSEELERVLATVPQATVLEIESPGGRILEAKKMMQLVRDRGLNTYTAALCESAATLVLLSGSQRVVNARAKVGFHAGFLPGATAEQQRGMDELVRTTMKSAGVADDFIEHTLETPSSSIWFPTYKEMRAAGVATGETFGNPFAARFPRKGSAEWARENQVAQAKVVAEYPAIGVPNSALNREFLEEVKFQDATDPALFDNPAYPTEIVKILQARNFAGTVSNP